MKKSKQLKKVIEYAVERGWEPGSMVVVNMVVEQGLHRYIISMQSFAKAVFGLDKWQYHLQQAVISEDPRQYYFDYINEKKEHGKL